MRILFTVFFTYLFIHFNSIFPSHFLSRKFVTKKLNNVTCPVKTNILFLKTHKTAGSTIQNIFLRFADAHNLLLVMPKKGNYLGHPRKFVESIVPKLKPGYKYNIFAHHSRFDYRPMRHLMPNDCVFITILRDPIRVFESLYQYHHLNRTFQMNISEFANFYSDKKRKQTIRRGLKFGANQMAFDLGIEPKHFYNSKAIRKAIKSLDRRFHLVLISEMMDESLILLKHLLCWTNMDDVVSLKHNVRTDKHRNVLSNKVVEQLRLINYADQLIYDYFYRKFLKRKRAFGEVRMRTEVAQLRNRTKQLYNYCILADNLLNSQLSDKKFRVYSAQVTGFKLKKDAIGNQSCENLAKQELPYTRELFNKQKMFLL